MESNTPKCYTLCFVVLFYFVSFRNGANIRPKFNQKTVFCPMDMSVFDLELKNANSPSNQKANKDYWEAIPTSPPWAPGGKNENSFDYISSNESNLTMTRTDTCVRKAFQNIGQFSEVKWLL